MIANSGLGLSLTIVSCSAYDTFPKYLTYDMKRIQAVRESTSFLMMTYDVIPGGKLPYKISPPSQVPTSFLRSVPSCVVPLAHLALATLVTGVEISRYKTSQRRSLQRANNFLGPDAFLWTNRFQSLRQRLACQPTTQ